MADRSVTERLMAKIKSGNNFSLGSAPTLLSDIPYWVPSGIPVMDAILGGGIPGGRLVELYGDAATYKSSLALQVLSEVQKMGGLGLLLDPEATTTREMAARAGVNVDELIFGYPNTIEELYDDYIRVFLDGKEKLDEKQDSPTPAIIVWDSIASTVPAAELKTIETKGLGKASMAEHARAISKMLRILPRQLAQSQTTGLFVNQTRQKLGVLFGDKNITPGGKALKFYASVRIELKIIRRHLNSDKKAIGVEVQATIIKNKVGIPFGRCKFPVLFDRGVDNAIACFWYLKELGVITVGGGWHSVQLGGSKNKFRITDWHDMYDDNLDEVHELVRTGETLQADKQEYEGED